MQATDESSLSSFFAATAHKSRQNSSARGQIVGSSKIWAEVSPLVLSVGRPARTSHITGQNVHATVDAWVVQHVIK